MIVNLVLTFFILFLLSGFSIILIQEARVIGYLKDSLRVKSAILSGLELGIYHLTYEDIGTWNKIMNLYGTIVNINLSKEASSYTIRAFSNFNHAKRQLVVEGDYKNLQECVLVAESVTYNQELYFQGVALARSINKPHNQIITGNFRPFSQNTLNLSSLDNNSEWLTYDNLLSLLSDSQNVSYSYINGNLHIYFRGGSPEQPRVFFLENLELTINGSLILNGDPQGTIIIINQDISIKYPLEFKDIMFIIKGKALMDEVISGQGILWADEFIFSRDLVFNGMIIANNVYFQKNVVLIKDFSLSNKLKHLLVKGVLIIKDWRYQL